MPAWALTISPSAHRATPLPVGQAAALAPDGQLRVGLDGLQQLPHQPALADPRHADQGDELHRLLAADAGQRGPEQLDLALAADQPTRPA
jgi:hypothetical protein